MRHAVHRAKGYCSVDRRQVVSERTECTLAVAGMKSAEVVRPPCGKGPGRSTSLTWSRGGVCRWAPQTPSSGAASHGLCTLASS